MRISDWSSDVCSSDLASRPGIEVLPGETMRIGYINFDATGSSGVDYFKDKRVRQAVKHAINREAIDTALIGQGSTVINSACYPSPFGCEQAVTVRSEEHTSELQSLMRISYSAF